MAVQAQLVFFLGTVVLVQNAFCTAEQQVICTTETVTASVTPVHPSVSIQCPESSKNEGLSLVTQFSKYESEACDEEHLEDTVTAVLTGFQAQGGWTGNKLSISQFPRDGKKMCVICKQDAKVTCRVVVDIAKDAQSCSREVDKPVNLNLTLSQSETVYFRCPPNDKLSPDADAYQENCEASVALPAGLDRQDNSAANAYSLTLKTAPQTEQRFCYVCSADAKEKTASEKCFIKVTTQTTTQSPSNSPTTSGTVLSTLSLLLACGIALATSSRL